MSLDGVASWCSLFFIGQYFWHVFYSAKSGWISSIHPGNKQWKAIQDDVASISKGRVLLPHYKQPSCFVVIWHIN